MYAVELKTDSLSSYYTFIDKVNNKPVITYWYSGNVPDNNGNTEQAELKIHATSLKSPLLIDIRTGLVYKIPKSAINKRGTFIQFTIPVYDSPLLVCDSDFLNVRGIK